MQALQDYSFEVQPGETVTWTVTRRIGDRGQVASGVGAFEAVTRARRDQAQRLQTETGQMNQQKQLVDQQLEVLKTHQEQDIEALTRRVTQLEAQVVVHKQTVRQRSGEFQALTDQTRETREETASRREDVIRLRNELEELRTDVYQLKNLRRILTDRLLRLQFDNQDLHQRETQLRQQLGDN